MAQDNRLTNNADETEFSSLLDGEKIFEIPFFQRRYKWSSSRVEQLQSDLTALVNGEEDCHFMGAIIIHGRKSNPSDPRVFDVIDGQQRITTVLLHLLAIAKVYATNGDRDSASGVIDKFLLLRNPGSNRCSYKLHCCGDDRSELNKVFKEVLGSKSLKEKYEKDLNRPLQASAHVSQVKGSMLKNYKSALKYVSAEYQSAESAQEGDGKKRVDEIYTALVQGLSIVQIDVADPLNGPKIFDSLNSRQEPMTPGDLVRNEIFRRANATPDELLLLEANHWGPFYSKFNYEDCSGKNPKQLNYFEKYFFPFGLVKKPNTKKSDLFNSLSEDWESTNKTPIEIINELREFQDAFIDTVTGSNTSQISTDLHKKVKRLHSTKLPTSIYPYLMKLIKTASEDADFVPSAKEIVEVLESFLVRRACCGHSPTGLHAVFKSLWQDCEEDHSAEKVRRVISTQRTVEWPDDTTFESNLREREIYIKGSSLCKFLLVSYEQSLGGDLVVIDDDQIEHILPQSPDAHWKTVFNEKQRKAMTNRLANLLPISSEMNKSLSNKPYLAKRKKYKEDSKFKSTRNFAESIQEWNPEALEERATKMASWGLAEWPHSKPVSE